MNEKEIIDALKKGAEADAPLHSSHVRRALMSAHKERGFAPLRRLITTLVMNRYSVPTTVFGIVALALVFNFVALDPNTVSAEEMANRAYARAIKISPEMRAQLEEKMKADMLETLAEAKAAPDLRILTKEEFEKESPFSISTTSVGIGKPFHAMPDAPAGQPHMVTAVHLKAIHAATGTPIAIKHRNLEWTEGQPVSGTVSVSAGVPLKGAVGFSVSGTAAGGEFKAPPEPVKYLSYTDPRGNKTVLGLDENDTPVFKFSELKDMKIMPIEGDRFIGVPAEKALFFKAKAGVIETQE